MAEKFGAHVERLHAVAASPSRRLLAIGGARDVAQGGQAGQTAQAAKPGSRVYVAPFSKLEAASAAIVDDAVLALAFVGDDLLVAGLASGTIVGWDTANAGTSSDAALPEVLRLTGAHRGAVRALDAAPAERGRGAAPAFVLVSVGDDGMLRVGTLEAASEGAGPRRFTLVAERSASARALQAVILDPQGKTVAAAGDDSVIRTWAIDALQAAPREMPCGDSGIGALCFTGDGRIAAGCGDGSIQLCYLEGAVDAENRAGDAAHTAMVRGMVMSAELVDETKRPLPQRLFSIAEDGSLKAWQLDTKRKPRSIELGSVKLTAMVLVPASRGAKPDRRGGTLVVTDDQRGLHLVTVNDQAEPADAVERVRSALDRLRGDLDASGVKVRLDAVDALAELPEDDARQLLDRALARDAKPEVRKRAAEAMGRSRRRLSRPALRQALADSDASVRRAALDALVAIESDAPLAPLRAALASSHADIRSLAVSRLPALRAASPLVPGLVAGRLADNATEVRRAALDALYAIAGSDALQPVHIAMQRGPADVRVEALTRLGRARLAGTPGEAGAAALLEAALDDDAAEVRTRALLVAVGARQRLAVRVRAVDAELAKALAELEAQGRLAEPWDARQGMPALTDDDVAPLFSALTCRHATTALRAARWLGALGDARATGALLQLTREPAAEVRREAIAALVRAALSMPADTRIPARLEWLLDDEDATVRAAAFDALSELDPTAGPGATLELAALALGCASEDVRLRALPILVEFGGKGRHAGQRELTGKAGELLGRALDDEHGKVRAQAFTTLWTWYSGDPRTPLTLGAACRHGDIRKRVVDELARIKGRNPGHWADDLLLALVGDSTAEVGLAAFEVLTGKRDEAKRDEAGAKESRDSKAAARVEIYREALDAPRPEVRAAGCKAAPRSTAEALRARLIELVKEPRPDVHLAAIEALDRLVPDDAEGFALAFDSEFYELRVRAAELCGKRRDTRAVGPAQALLTIPLHHFFRPSDQLRQRMARALADVGDRGSLPFLVSLLEDPDPLVREMAARGLATSCRPGDEKPLVDALSHADLPVRSWVAEGLARLGDARAVAVLAGTLAHDHRPIRVGAILGFVALGADGVRGILQGLDDRDRDIQDLVFAVIIARDVALARAGQAPDLLLSALSSSSPEIRFGAARILEARMSGEDLGQVAQELVGPRKPEKAADMKEWPAEDERRRRLDAVIGALASDHPAQRYAAAQVLSLRAQPLAFWREAGRLVGPTAADRPRIPYTNWEDSEAYQPRKQGWIRSLLGRGSAAPATSAPLSATERVLTVLSFAGAPGGRAVPPLHAGFAAADAHKLAFGVYAGLLRQAPARGEADETHRVRRDSIARLAALAANADVGRDAALPALRRALSDPHHLVRKAATSALRSLYPEGSLAPLELALQATAADVGRAAVDEIVAAAMAGNADARSLAGAAIDAPVPEVRAHALSQIPRLFEPGSLEPWLIALDSRHADVRLSVVDRLLVGLEGTTAGAHGEALQVRAAAALARAMESDHEDLRLKAAVALARRGDARTVDVLAGILRAEDAGVAARATDALVELAHARPKAADAATTSSAAAVAIAARLEDDPDRTANRPALIDALGRIGSPAGSAVLLNLLDDDDAAIRTRALTTLLALARKRDELGRVLAPRPMASDASTRQVPYDEPQVLTYLGQAATRADARLRVETAQALRDVEERGAEALLARLAEDREPAVRVAATESLAFRAEHFTGATLDALASALRGGRRELVLPAAVGLASRSRPEAFQALLLVFKAGEQAERERAVVALGQLGDRRALEELEPLLAKSAELAPEDAALAPAAAEALGRLLPRLRNDDPAHPDEQRRVRELVVRLASEGAPVLRKRALTGLRHAAAAGEGRHLLERIVADAYDEVEVRAHAVEELGKLGNTESEAVLADVLSESDTRLRRTAMEALERIFPRQRLENRTRTSLLALRSPFADISAKAASFLADEGDPATLVGRLAEIESDDIRRRLRQGLIRRGACPVNELVAVLAGKGAGSSNDSDAQRQDRALADAVWIAGAAATGNLAADDRSALRAAVAPAGERAATAWRSLRASLGALERASDTDAARLARAEDAWRASLWAALRLDADAGRAARDALASASSPIAPAAVRREALHFLARHGKQADLELVRPMLTDADASVRAAAAAAYAALAPERAAKLITELPVPDAAALQPVAAAALASEEDARRLVESRTGRRLVLPVMLGQKRTAALEAVARAGGKDPARLVAIAALGRIGGDDADAALTAIFRDEREVAPVRAAAYRALRRLQREAARTERFREEDQP